MNTLVKKILFVHLIVLLVTSCDVDSPDEKKLKKNDIQYSQKSITIDAISLNNKGVGEMGSFAYDKATLTFENLLKQNNNWALAQQNLAIALLNRQQPGDEEKAMSIAENLSKLDNDNLVAHYIVAILKFNQGLCEAALPRFEIIIRADKTDAYALYFAGQCYLQNGELVRALELYQQAIKEDSYLRSAYYGSFMVAQRLSKNDLSKEMLNAYQKLESNPKARLAEIKYTRMGPKANAQTYVDPLDNQIKSKKTIQAPFFNSPKPVLLANINVIETFGLVNFKQTESTQMYVVADNQLSIYQSVVSGAKKLTNFSLDLNQGPHQLAWGDINNDGKIDVYVAATQDQLYLQTETGFDKINMQNFGLTQLSSKAVRLSDADHDGDLDILLLSKIGIFEIWNNNLDNTFTPLSTKVEFPKSNDLDEIFIQDVDKDRDVDIILMGKNQLVTLLNDRMWDYEILNSDFSKDGVLALTFADNNLNGLPELNLRHQDDSISTYEFDKNTNGYKSILLNKPLNILADSIVQIDINGNTQNEFLAINKEGIKIIDATGKTLEQILLNNIQKVKVIHTSLGPELLVLQNNQLKHIAASGNRLPFILFNFTGKEDDANSVRSNYSGIGTSFTIRNQAFYASGDSFHNLNGYDQDYQGISVAAGPKKTLDFIEIQWSDGVYQTELGLSTGEYHLISETQRQLSSCPVIFAWNNGQYQFASDVLGVGGIGFAVGRHEYGVPRPWENYLLDSDQLSTDEGVFKLQFTEPMEESAYLDELKIEVIDIAKEWSVTLDERMVISGPETTGGLLFYQSIISPIQVLDKSANDVTALALETDKQAVNIENHDHRFLGLVDEQVITMEFGEMLIGDYHLIMNGWVEYGYSQTMFAAWQAGKVAHAPTLEYKVGGEWKTLLLEFGYPAGMPRKATVPISIPEKTRYLRIKTNMEIYFDQLGLIQTGEPELVKRYQLKLHKAHLQQLGFPKRIDNKQRVPDYQFSKLSPFWDTRYMEGAYSQLGDITELVDQADNALAIIGAGEAIEFFFKDDLPKLDDGYNRFYLLKFKGWAKDMDILTHNGETLAPIPANGKVSAHAKELNYKYNNRFKAGK